MVWTKRRQPSYQLAVVVDDHRQGVTQVVRGADLLDSAARQLLLYRALGYTRDGGRGGEPTYTHLPLVLGPDGKRLAKRHGDTRVETYRRLGTPREAIVGLAASWCRSPHGKLAACTPAEFLAAFDLSRIPTQPITFTPEDDEWLRSQAQRE